MPHGCSFDGKARLRTSVTIGQTDRKTDTVIPKVTLLSAGDIFSKMGSEGCLSTLRHSCQILGEKRIVLSPTPDT